MLNADRQPQPTLHQPHWDHRLPGLAPSLRLPLINPSLQRSKGEGNPVLNRFNRFQARGRFAPGLAPVLACVFTLAGLLANAAELQKTFYVSKLGDNSDGRSWATAFATIQKALLALPDASGGCRVVIRPDTYVEANLYPAFKGALGAYNSLEGDFDGRLGSGTSGWVVIDSGDPAKGFKSYDWWGTIRATSKGWSPGHTEATFSAIGWDRWILRRLYATGGDAGLFWDCTDKVEPFTVLVEDCVSIGRAFGGGVGNCLSRTDEPITFRRCQLWALDFWGDTSGAYVRVENQTMPNRPDVRFEDCTLVGPQCSFKAGNYGFKTFTWASLNRCRLITLNFSQPAGTPTDGIIQSVQQGKFLHVDLEDCTLMGYKVFGVKVATNTQNEIQYTTKGSVNAYIQFQQEMPAGFLRLDHWPTETFAALAPPSVQRTIPGLVRDDKVALRDACEVTPIAWKGRSCLFVCVRPASGGSKKDYYLTLRDAADGKELARFAEGYSLASALVHDDKLYAFASRFESNNWNDVTQFESSDLVQWSSKRVIEQNAREHLFNSSVCAGPNGFVMAYESDDRAWPAFTVKFAQSKDLDHWTAVPDAIFGKKRYTACPTIRFANGYYYLLYTEHRVPRWFFETYIARSKDLVAWELSGANPVLSPQSIDDGINTSDADLAEVDGKTWLYYTVGDQRTWMNIKRAAFNGPVAQFLESWFTTPGVLDRN